MQDNGISSTSSADQPERVLRLFIIQGIPILAYDGAESESAMIVAREVNSNCYLRPGLEFEPGDVVLDIGAHVGIFSMFLAKKWPFLRVLAFEPFPSNYRNCLENLRLNGIENVELSPRAVTRDGRTLTMAVNPRNSGGASAVKETHRRYGVVGQIPSVRLDEILAKGRIGKCKLLKIDCEGLEYEILYDTANLSRMEYLSGEFHINRYLKSLDYTPERLLQYCSKWIPLDRISVQFCKVSD